MTNNETAAAADDGASSPHKIVARTRRRIVPVNRAPGGSAGGVFHHALPSSATTEPRGAYEVGYGKPPRKNQFKKGQSGNPKGRPKGAKSLKTIARKLLTEKISVRTGRGESRVTRIEAMMMKLIESASKGEFRALQAMFALYQQVMPDEPIDLPVGEAPLSATDAATLAMFVAEIQGMGSDRP